MKPSQDDATASPAAAFPPRKPRRQALKGAVILTDIGDNEITCIVRNMHEEGAELELQDGAELPERFLLHLPFERIGYKAAVRWRDGRRAGVQFTGTEPPRR